MATRLITDEQCQKVLLILDEISAAQGVRWSVVNQAVVIMGNLPESPIQVGDLNTDRANGGRAQKEESGR